jgi:hypothetical protein
MATPTHRALPEDLRRAQSQVQAWRKQRQPGRRIPASLWQLAVGLVKTYGVSRTATALRLDYYSLKQQVADAAGQPEASHPAFVEMPAPSFLVGKQARFEWDNGAGTTLRVHLVAYDTADLDALIRRLGMVE